VTDPPAISIVTPSYQHGRFLEWTIRSVLRQGYSRLEYVVMDGGSTDGTAEILKKYESQLTHVESAPDRGQADAVSRGFGHSSGEIMAYLNSDDLLAPGALDFVAQFFSDNPQVDAIYSHRVFIDDANIVDKYWILPEHRNWLMKRWDYIPQETCFWRRRIYEQAGGINASFQFALDYDLFVRFMELGRMERVNRFLGAFRQHAASKTATLKEGIVHPEVARVRKVNHIWFPRGHGFMELGLSRWVESQSRNFAASGGSLPGSIAGIGYNYDQVWKGQLSD
jgi:glycosyltransferase involved in cell wall biosynthesis